MNDISAVISTLDSKNCGQWDTYVKQHPNGTFFHLSGWERVIRQSFGHKTNYMMAKENGIIVGILPLGHVKSKIFGNSLVSSPFCVYGGAIADNEIIKTQLEMAAESEAIKLGVDYLELRNVTPSNSTWPVKELYVTFRKDLDKDPDINMKAIPRKQRAMVRKGIKAGLESYIHDDIETFFRIYSTSVRNHGTPVFPKKYFLMLKEVFGKDAEIRVVMKGKKAISTVMSFYFRDEVLPYYGGGLPEARQINAFDFMYWDLMQFVCQNGIRIFDYGRSKLGTGSYSFKKNWGFEPTPLPYAYRLINIEQMPQVNPLNPKYQLFIKAWQRLPLPVANTIGPWLARNLG